MGLLNASMYGSYAPGTGVKPPMPQPQQPMMPQGMGPISNNEFGNAFAGNPQFMQQLQAMQNGMGPGRQPPHFTPPPMQMSTMAPNMAGRGAGFGGGNPLHNYGMQTGDPAGLQALQFLRGTAF